MGIKNLYIESKPKEIRLGNFVILASPNAGKYWDEVDPYYTPDGELKQRQKGIRAGFPTTPYYADLGYEYEGDPKNHVGRAIELSERFLTILRLFKQGRIEGKLYRVWDKSSPDSQSKSLILHFGALNVPTDPYSYELGDNDIAQLQSFFTELYEVDQSRFSLAIDRFNDSYARERERDRFIDLLIALEALFSEGTDSIGYKIRLRCACFLGKFPGVLKSKHKVFEFLKTAYDQRSGILHGRKQSLDWVSQENNSKLEHLVRQSLIHMLLEAKNGDILTPDKLDRFLFLERFSENENMW